MAALSRGRHGAAAAFDVVAMDPGGARIAMAAHITLMRQIPDWRLVVTRGTASFETTWREEPVDSHDMTIPADGTPMRLAWRLGFGRYKLQVVQAGRGLAAASRVFTAGWSDSGDPDVPARVRVSTGRARCNPGETARVHLVRNLDLTENIAGGGLDVDVPVGADWWPGAYVAVNAYHPVRDGMTSERAIGATWVQVDPAARILPVAIEAPPVLRPRSQATVAVRTSPGAWLTLAAVDEGVLRPTGFTASNPVGHFLGKRALGVDIRDEWGRLRDLVDNRCKDADKVMLIMGQLNIHSPASLHEAFLPAEARRVMNKLDIHHTPKHGSWLNGDGFAVLASGGSLRDGRDQLGVFRRDLPERVASRATLERHAAARQHRRNTAATKADWRFTTADARIKLRKLYPSA